MEDMLLGRNAEDRLIEEWHPDMIDLGYIAECKIVGIAEKMVDWLEKDGGFPRLLEPAIEKLRELDPKNIRFVIDTTPSNEAKQEAQSELSDFLNTVQSKDQRLTAMSNVKSSSDASKPAMSDVERLARAVREKTKGNESFRCKDYEEAISFYEASLQLDPTQIFVYTNLAMSCLKLEQFDAAKHHAEKAMEMDPQYWKAYWRRGQAYAGLKQRDLAEVDFHRAVELCPSEKSQNLVRRDLKGLYGEGESKRTGKKSKKQEEKKPDKSWQKVQIREADSDDDDDDDVAVDQTPVPLNSSPNDYKKVAIVEVDDDSDDDDDVPSAGPDALQLKMKGNVAFKEKNYAAAVHAYTEAINLQPEDISIYYSNRSAAYQQLGDLPKVVNDCALALQTHVTDDSNQSSKDFRAKQYMRRGLAFGSLQQYAKALDDFDLVVRLNPATLASVQPHMMKFALELTKEAVSQVTDMKRKGNAAFASGNFGKAAEQFTAALDECKRAQKRAVNTAAADDLTKLIPALVANRAFCSLKLELWEDAKNDCDFIIESDPNHAKAIFRRGQAYAGLGKHRLAVRDYERVLRLTPEAPQVDALLQKSRELSKAAKTPVDSKTTESGHADVPATYFDFRRLWSVSTTSKRAALLSSWSNVDFTKLFAKNLTPEDTASILSVLASDSDELNDTLCLSILHALGSSNQHAVNVMMLGDDDIQNVKTVIQNIKMTPNEEKKLKEIWDL